MDGKFEIKSKEESKEHEEDLSPEEKEVSPKVVVTGKNRVSRRFINRQSRKNEHFQSRKLKKNFGKSERVVSPNPLRSSGKKQTLQVGSPVRENNIAQNTIKKRLSRRQIRAFNRKSKSKRQIIDMDMEME